MKFKNLFSVVLLLPAFYVSTAQGILIDHTCTDATKIPQNWIESVKQTVNFHYAHTSHGEQLIYGLMHLQEDNPNLAHEVTYNGIWENPDVFSIWDGQTGGTTYITPDLYWESPEGLQMTHDVLSGNPLLNVSGWMWCTQLDEWDEAHTEDYLEAMQNLESQFPDVTFVYFTGNAQATGDMGYNRHLRNEQIREFCQSHNKVLFDFGDIDAWYNGQMNSYNYGSTSVPLEHSAFHGEDCAHANELSCLTKGNAFWWLAARLAGWDGSMGAAENPDTQALFRIGYDGIELMINSEACENAVLRIYAITGNLLSENTVKPGQNSYSLPAGNNLYFLTLQTGAETFSRKFIAR